MKDMNFSFICALILMMGSLGLIQTEPHPKLNFRKPLLDKPRRLEGDEGLTNYILVKYGKNVDFSWTELVGVSFYMNGAQIYQGIEPTSISAGTKIEIRFSSAQESLEGFFKTYDGNYESIISVDLSNFDSSNLQSINSLFKNCSSLKFANLSNLKANNLQSLESVFEGCNNLEILDLSNFRTDNINTVNSFFSEDTKLRYLNIKGASLSDQILEAITNILDGELNIICKDEDNSLAKGNSVNTCCDFDAEVDKCESSNYIKVFFGGTKTFTSGFTPTGNDRNKKDISFVIHDNSILLSTQAFTANNGSILEVYFKSILTTLEYYFNYEEQITSVDFSHFNATEVTSILQLFNGCVLLKTIDLSYFKTSKISNAQMLFDSCNNLESVNLSHITTEPITNAKYMFSTCGKLKTLDISGLNMESADASSAFNGLSSLKYINIKDTKLSENIINDIKTLENDLTICQDNPILAKKGYKYACCSYEDGEEICKVPNSITVYFAEEENNIFQFTQEDIDYIISGNSAYIKSDEEPTINFDSKMDIFFKSSPTSLEGFFKEANNIITVDFSNFDSSSVNSFKNIFKNCSALQSVDLSPIKTNSLTDIGNLFNGCKSLISVNFPHFEEGQIENMEALFNGCQKIISIDLSNLKTKSNVTITSLFNGCTSLKKIDISGLDFSSAQKTNDVFSNLESLKYINIMDIDASIDIKNDLKNNLNEKNDLKVCQNSNILESDKITNICCNYNAENERCESINYIIVYYGEDIKYESKFGNDYRHEIRYIISGDSLYTKDESFEISKGSKIEISLSSSITSLEKFFDKNYDNNAQYIESIDLSNFDWSNVVSYESTFNGCSSLKKVIFPKEETPSLTKMGSMFNGCSSLLAVDLSKFNTGGITNLDNLLNGCSSLKAINIQGINLIKVNSNENIFEGINPLNYINIKDAELPDNIKNLLIEKFNNQENLIVCQNQDKILNKENYKEVCCDYDEENDKCGSSNFIIIYS